MVEHEFIIELEYRISYTYSFVWGKTLLSRVAEHLKNTSFNEKVSAITKKVQITSTLSKRKTQQIEQKQFDAGYQNFTTTALIRLSIRDD